MNEKQQLLVLDNSDETDNLDVIAMAPVMLECPNAECNLGTSGAKYKTPEVEIEFAMKLLELHVQQNHGQGKVVAAANTGNKNMRERQKKPTADMEMTEARWRKRTCWQP